MKIGWLLPALTLCVWGCEKASSTDPSRSVDSMLQWSKTNPTVTEETWRGVSRLSCTPTLVDVCDNDRCLSRKFSGDHPVVVNWFPQKGEYQRCDAKGQGCNSYRPQVHYSGSFANLTVPESAVVFRVTASGEYREVASMMTETYVYRGRCSKE